MNKRNNSRKGATLAELIIVLAVLVIAATMVVSFSSMMHGAQGISNERFEAMQDVTAAESIIEGFIESNSGTNTFAYVTKTGNNEKLNIYNNGETKSAFFINGFISVADLDKAMQFEHIESVAFELEAEFVSEINNPDGSKYMQYSGDIIYYCTINYSVDKTNYTYTFCVNPYAGE